MSAASVPLSVRDAVCYFTSFCLAQLSHTWNASPVHDACRRHSGLSHMSLSQWPLLSSPVMSLENSSVTSLNHSFWILTFEFYQNAVCFQTYSLILRWPGQTCNQVRKHTDEYQRRNHNQLQGRPSVGYSSMSSSDKMPEVGDFLNSERIHTE